MALPTTTSTTTTLASLPGDLLHHSFDLLTGFDLLALSCACKSLRSEVERDQSIWKKRLQQRHDTNNGEWKQQYTAARSLSLEGDGRGAAIPLPNELPSQWQSDAFSVDLWFCMLPPKPESNGHSGGVLLGAQSSSFLDSAEKRPEFHQQLIHVDTKGNLFCSVTNNKRIIASKLQLNRWYHVALVYNKTLQCVFLDGALMHVIDEPLHVEWGKMKSLQFGNGFMTYGSKGRPSDAFVGWYGFHGLLDDHRVWDRALSMGDAAKLAHGERLETRSSPAWPQDGGEPTTIGNSALVSCTRPLERHYEPVRLQTA